ncbi:vWA domain-containing protein [Microlunatus speluncae]|uniref:vWA domain-containing protein n=1 Tax=Microlunatus speluncae TaxID=2594267 RepID=UPI0012664D24|nr:VWA domain-containing protein [Microlunatus speluncae]
MSNGSRASRLIILAVAAAVVLAGLMIGQSPARADDPVRVLLLLDVSGSMNEKVSSGGTKLAAAKGALKRVADSLPAGTQVGLRVYGSKIKEPKKENPQACRDSELVMPIGALDRNRMYQAVDSFQAVGETPIAYALEQSVADLGDHGRRVVVLISDGEENCVPDPCPVATKLAAKGVDLQFNAIGFDVNAKARKQLQCIVDETDGSYYDADDTDELNESLDKLTKRALRPFALSGAPIQGSTDPELPAPVRPGQYLESYDSTGDPRHYRIDRTPGSTVHLGISAVTPSSDDGYTDSWELRLETIDGTLCDTDTFGGGSVVSATVVASGSVSTAGATDACQRDPVLLKVRRAVWIKKDVRVELVLAEEPPITNLAELPPPLAKEPGGIAPVARQQRPAKVVGGLAFTDATPVQPGSYLDEIAVGETVVYKVSLQPGQRLRATLDAPRPGSDWGLESGYQGVVPRIIVLSPSRAEVDNEFTAVMGGGPAARLTAGSPEVRIRNREFPDPTVGDNHVRAASRGGDYYLAVSLDANKTNLIRTLLPIQLNVAVDGRPAGLPVYAAPTPTPSPGQSSPAAPPDSRVPTDAATPPVTAGPDHSTPPESDLQRIVLGALIGLLAAALLAGVIAVLVLRRRRR